MMKKAMAILMSLMMLAALAGCSSSAPETQEAAGDDVQTEASEPSEAGTEAPDDAETGGASIGLVIPTMTNEFFVDLKDGAESYAAEKGINLIALDSGDDSVKEASNVEDLITKGVELVLFIPVDSDAAVSSVESLNAADIPVITMDRSASGGEVVAHIASDNVAGGKLAGDYIVELLGGKGNVVELEGKVGTSAARDRSEGFNQAIEGTEIEVVAKQTANFDKAEGLTVMENILEAHPEVQAVFAANDEMALGAMEACAAAGKTDVYIVGFDASADAVKAVEDGTMAATVAQLPNLIAQYGIDTALQVLAGEEVEATVAVPLELVK